jgi:hypothetical protein
MFRCASVMAFAIVVGACNSTEFRTDIEDRVTISQGVYGQTLTRNKPDSAPFYAGRIYVLAYSDDETGEADESYAYVLSGTEGLYQIQLNPGSFYLCAADSLASQAEFDCTEVEVPSGQRVRMDYCGGAGVGWPEEL